MDRYLWAMSVGAALLLIFFASKLVLRFVARMIPSIPIGSKEKGKKWFFAFMVGLVLSLGLFLIDGMALVECRIERCGWIGLFAVRVRDVLAFLAFSFLVGVVVLMGWTFLSVLRHVKASRVENAVRNKSVARKAKDWAVNTKDGIQAELERRSANKSVGKPRYDQGEGTMYGARGEDWKE
jgi:hypothetical protein